MKWYVFAGLLLFCLAAGAQPEATKNPPEHAFYIPRLYTDSTSSLAAYIQKKFKGREQQIYAAYIWVTANIKYDKDSMLSINWSKENDEKIAATLRRRKGVCDNFASVFADILTRMQIKAYVVNGLTRQDGRAARVAHSWVAVHAEDQWLFCDPTWDAGYNGSPRFYLNSPAEFMATHWPFDPMWQMATNPVSLKEFENLHTWRKSGITTFVSPEDSVENFLSLSPLEQLEATNRRMKTLEQPTQLIKNWHGYNNMNLAIFYEDQDMKLYNEAVANLNQANLHLNKFIAYRNNLFEPLKADEQLQEMLQAVAPAIARAFTQIKSIGTFKENYQYDPAELTQKLKNTETRLQQQKDFLQRYLSTSSDQRKQVCY